MREEVAHPGSTGMGGFDNEPRLKENVRRDFNQALNREGVRPRFWLGLPCPVPTPAGHMSPAGTPSPAGFCF